MEPRPSVGVDVLLADGTTAHVRPVVAGDDDAAVAALFGRLSPTAVYNRFFSPMPTVPTAQIERLTHVDGHDRVALVAEIGGRIVALAGYDRRPGDEEAEVAFVVDDVHQGVGIGTLLLEHLAAIAREHDVTGFVADTLSSNHQMQRVFRHAGMRARSSFDGGVVHYAFPIEPTGETHAAIQHREHLAESRSIARVLRPHSIAVIGAGREPGGIGHAVLQNLLRASFNGPIYPVHPTAPHVAGVPAHRTVLELPDDVDLAVVAVPADAVAGVVDECGRKGAHGVVVISAGFAELGEAGLEREREVLRTARNHGMRVFGPNCLGILNTAPDVRLNATFAPVSPRPGRVGFLSQSGAMGIAVLSEADRLDIGISTFASVGNKADVSGNDLLQYWEDDPDTDVILLYLESFGNPRKFSRLARRVARRKPIVAVKSGRTGSGTRAASSHTAALATADVAVDALFRQAGVIRVDTLEQLFDVTRVLSHQPLPAGPRVGILGNSGGPGILAADACEAAGLAVPELSEPLRQALRDDAPPGAAVGNPVDLVASATAGHYERALRRLLASGEVDAALVIFTPPLVTRAEEVATAIGRAVSTAPAVPVLATFLAGPPPAALRGEGGGPRVPVFGYPEPAAHALARVVQYARWRQRPVRDAPLLDGIDAAGGRDVAKLLLAEQGGWLDETQAAALLGHFGIRPVESIAVHDPDDAAKAADSIGGPVALKAVGAALVHKTDAGGVRLDLRSPDEVADAFRAMKERLGDGMDHGIVQAMAAAGVETIVGVVQDPTFGPLLMFGMGGTAAELLRDQAFALVPLSEVDVDELIRTPRSAPLLDGYRGAPAGDVGALRDLLLRVGRLAAEVPEVAELDLNPVVVTPVGVAIVDVKVRLEPAVPQLDVRRLR